MWGIGSQRSPFQLPWEKGYQQTIFTRHAPTVESRTELTDRELGELLKVQGIEPYSSRRTAIAELEKLVKEIDGKDTKT